MGEAVHTQGACEHKSLTAFKGSGWVCADCRVPVLSLMLPIPLPLIGAALAAISTAPAQPQGD